MRGPRPGPRVNFLFYRPRANHRADVAFGADWIGAAVVERYYRRDPRPMAIRYHVTTDGTDNGLELFANYMAALAPARIAFAATIGRRGRARV